MEDLLYSEQIFVKKRDDLSVMPPRESPIDAPDLTRQFLREVFKIDEP